MHNAQTKPRGRYLQSCYHLKSFLLKQIPKMWWMNPFYRGELLTVVNHIKIEKGAREQLWEIVIGITEIMIDNDVDVREFVSFFEKANDYWRRTYE